MYQERDMLAALALLGILTGRHADYTDPIAAANKAYNYAEALLKVRKERYGDRTPDN